MDKLDWLLVSCICSGLSELERDHHWDLDNGEVASLLESFYQDLKAGPPSDYGAWLTIFENAYVNAWGKDHECDVTPQDTIKCMIHAVDVYYEAIESSFDVFKYINGIFGV